MKGKRYKVPGKSFFQKMFFFQLFVDVKGRLPHSSVTQVFIEGSLANEEEVKIMQFINFTNIQYYS